MRSGLIGAGVGVAVSGLVIWLKRPQYTEDELLMADYFRAFALLDQ